MSHTSSVARPADGRLPSPAVWIAWERHRRSRVLAESMGVELWEMLSGLPYALRVVVLAMRTTARLLRRRPRLTSRSASPPPQQKPITATFSCFSARN